MKTVLVRYKVKPEHAEPNRELIRAVYGELELTQLADFNYATFALDDGVSFVHLAAHGYETNPLAELLSGVPGGHPRALRRTAGCDRVGCDRLLRVVSTDTARH
jgi:hypothetical protein